MNVKCASVIAFTPASSLKCDCGLAGWTYFASNEWRWSSLISDPLVSILINNYNYGRYLRMAIDSALAQTYRSIEVIIVDDGSTDESRDIIVAYGDRVGPVFQENQGQGSAFNSGVAASRGDILCFLDADDFFYPQKVERIVDVFRRHGTNSTPIMVHHMLAVKDELGNDLEGALHGKTHDNPLNLYGFAKQHRFIWYEAGPTTSLAINRSLADRVFPLPEEGVRISGDDFIVCGASLLGDVYSVNDILGGYRVHVNNNWFRSERRKSPEFLDILQNYLNAKLVENSLLPVIAFDDSIYVWSGLAADRRWLKLGFHMLKLAVKRRDRYTTTFVYHTLMTIGMLTMKSLRERTRWVRSALGS
jgi:glycosyltransferase involved in cell wall biosynthesis